MAEEFEGQDLSDSEFWGVDLSRARFRDVNLTGARFKNVWLVDVEMDALVDRLVVNGVDVTQYVNEHDRWYPLRAMLRPTDPAGMRAAWDALQAAWAPTIERAAHLTEEQRHESVGGEWSIVETLRHLVMAMDKWFTVPVLGEPTFHPIGVPNTGSKDFGFPGLDPEADPSFEEVLAVRRQRAERLRAYLDELQEEELARQVDVLENGVNPVQECLFTVFEEEFEHHRYALRDLDLLDPRPQG